VAVARPSSPILEAPVAAGAHAQAHRQGHRLLTRARQAAALTSQLREMGIPLERAVSYLWAASSLTSRRSEWGALMLDSAGDSALVNIADASFSSYTDPESRKEAP